MTVTDPDGLEEKSDLVMRLSPDALALVELYLSERAVWDLEKKGQALTSDGLHSSLPSPTPHFQVKELRP
ncbi:MAG: hypothetical protein ABSB53_05090 [Nitrososphaerales archaeon]|jgi:hypothetical protein